MRAIDADELIKWIEDRYEITWEADTYEGGIKDACSDMLEKIDNMPTIEPQQTCEYWDSESKFCALCRPSAQPQRKKGRWIERNPQNSDKCRLIECDQCGFSHIVGFNVPYEHWIENRNFCERCGADMRGEQDDE